MRSFDQRGISSSLAQLGMLVAVSTGSGCASCGDTEDTPSPSAEAALKNGEALSLELSDGVRVSFSATTDPGLQLGDPITRVGLSRSSETIELDGSELTPFGLVLTLEFEPFDSEAFANTKSGHAGRVSASSFMPTFTIPKQLLSGANLDDVLAVARIGDSYSTGVFEPESVRFVPAEIDEEGNLTFTDLYFPHSILSDLEATAAGLASDVTGGLTGPRRIRFAPALAVASVNWTNPPVLVRMIPTREPPYRVPLDELTIRDPERAAIERESCKNNIVVLVHGHNEKERAGFTAGAIEAPWLFAYKRDVWTLFYDYLARQDSRAKLGCTAFYEFIYPTYRPIMTPHGTGARLDQSFSTALATELAPLLQSGDDYRLYIVAHSMGGPVSRAGIQLFDERLLRWFEKFVSWGSPHLGSPLPSLGFALAAAPPYLLHTPPNPFFDELGVPEELAHSEFLYELLVELSSSIQLPAPGPRDYRWAGSTVNPERHRIRLENILELSEAQRATERLAARFNLQTGTWIDNPNLRTLNDLDRFVHSDKYVGIFGITEQSPTWETTAYGYLTYPTMKQTGLGALVIKLVMDSQPDFYQTHNKNQSDGAVPLESMIASGVFGLGNLYFLAGVDHEEYYGAPDSNAVFSAADKATRTFDKTTLALDFLSDPVGCPSLSFTEEPDHAFESTEQITIEGSLSWPGDTTPGSRIREVALRSGGDTVGSSSHGQDGKLHGDVAASALPQRESILELLVELKDGTRLRKEWTVTVEGCRFEDAVPNVVTFTVEAGGCFAYDQFSLCFTPTGGSVVKSADPGCGSFVSAYEVSGATSCNSASLTYRFDTSQSTTYPGCSPIHDEVILYGSYSGSVDVVWDSQARTYGVTSRNGSYSERYESATCEDLGPDCSSTAYITSAR
ncbi:MAG: hypothetical protein HY791_09665 [Deltaproteobacteria bacterium]|nr:hypothetical protein [Deltaproteobacteria bacterium]